MKKMTWERVTVMPDELAGEDVEISIGVEVCDELGTGVMVTIAQGEDRVVMPGELWRRFVGEGSELVERGTYLLGEVGR